MDTCDLFPTLDIKGLTDVPPTIRKASEALELKKSIEKLRNELITVHQHQLAVLDSLSARLNRIINYKD